MTAPDHVVEPLKTFLREWARPAPDRFVGEVEPAFGKELLDIAVAQGEAEVEPDRVLDDLGREAMAAVGERGHGVRIAQSGQPYRRPDNALADYARSGYDRGHMSPSGDMATPNAQHQSFSLANMIPQHPCNNEVLWEGIESAVRDLASAEGEIYVVTGPIYEGTDIPFLNGRVGVPSRIYKAVYRSSPSRRSRLRDAERGRHGLASNLDRPIGPDHRD